VQMVSIFIVLARAIQLGWIEKGFIRDGSVPDCASRF